MYFNGAIIRSRQLIPTSAFTDAVKTNIFTNFLLPSISHKLAIKTIEDVISSGKTVTKLTSKA